MRIRQWAFVGVLFVGGLGVVLAQTQSSSTSSSRNGGASASSSSSARTSSSGGQGGQAFAASVATPTHVIFYNPGEKWEPGKSMKEQRLQNHGQYLAQMVQKGTLIFGGPWRDEPGALAVIRAANDAEAQAFLDNDPGVKSGVLTGEVKAWEVVFRGPGQPGGGQVKLPLPPP